MKLSYITCTWNHKDYIKNWYNSLKTYMPKDVDYEIIIVDNASMDGTIEYLKTLTDVNLICMDENCGEGKGFNVAMKATTGDFIYKSDPDVYFTGEFHSYMNKYFNYPEVGVVVGHNPGWDERRRKGKDYDEVYLIPGAFFCVNRKTLNEVGYWEDHLFYSGAEFDYTARCRMKDIKIARALVPDGASSHINHCGRFQYVDKDLIPKHFGKDQEMQWSKLWATGIGCCYYYILRGWLEPEDLHTLNNGKTNILKYYPNIDLDKNEGYLGNWGK